MKICVPIQAEAVDTAKAMMQRAFTVADVVELRIDGMKDPDLKRLLPDKAGKILVTNRRREEGGAYDGPEAERVALLMEAVSLGADYIDAEASTDPALLLGLKERIVSCGNRTKLILSRHDFTGTPSERMLKKALQDMTAIGGDIIKIVTYAKTAGDNLRLLSLVSYARRRRQDIIAFCMGPLGRPSRFLTTILGAYLTYASLERGAESAPGQLTVDQMKKIWDILKYD